MSVLDRLIFEIKDAADSHEVARLSAACSALIAQLPLEEELIDVNSAQSVLRTLRNSRRFDQMRNVAEAIVREGCDDPMVRHQFAQALIDSGETTPAIGVLSQLAPILRDSPSELAEVQGLFGRAWKDIALSANRPQQQKYAFNKAYESYRVGYELDRGKNLIWHGINMVALAHADRNGTLASSVREEALGIASAIIDAVRETPVEKRQVWDLAAAGEALVALDRVDESTEWFRGYVEYEGVDAFALGGTLRQLTDIYRLDELPSGSELLAPLRARLLELPGGNLTLKKDDLLGMAQVNAEQYERVLGNTGPKTYTWFMLALNSARSVALIRALGRGIGTGFLVRGSDLDPRFDDELLVLTNSHVVSDPPQLHAALPDDVSITFELAGTENDARQSFEIDQIVWSSPPELHDTSLLRLRPTPPASFKHLQLASNLPTLGGADIERVYIIGHPGGGEISFSLEDNELLDYDIGVMSQPDDFTACRVHYRAPTEQGSSGSPVFNGNWKTIALHHKGGETIPKLNGIEGTYPANEGIWLQSIVRAIRGR